MSNALREDALQKGPKSCLHFMVLFLVNKAPVEIRKRGFHFWKSPEFMFCLFPKCKFILFVEQLLLFNFEIALNFHFFSSLEFNKLTC